MFCIKVNEKIKLKLLMPQDSKDFFQLMEKNKSHLAHFMPRMRENNSIESTTKVIQIFLKQVSDNNGFRAGILYEDTLVGIIGFKYIDWINFKTEIMYWVDKDYLGKGITTQCVKKLMDIAFNEYKLNKVIIKSSVDNKASIRIAEKCGLILEGTCKSDELLLDGYTDICYYGITKEDYENLK